MIAAFMAALRAVQAVRKVLDVVDPDDESEENEPVVPTELDEPEPLEIDTGPDNFFDEDDTDIYSSVDEEDTWQEENTVEQERTQDEESSIEEEFGQSVDATDITLDWDDLDVDEEYENQASPEWDTPDDDGVLGDTAEIEFENPPDFPYVDLFTEALMDVLELPEIDAPEFQGFVDDMFDAIWGVTNDDLEL